jgi:riboflavin synthase alpha subunit
MPVYTLGVNLNHVDFFLGIFYLMAAVFEVLMILTMKKTNVGQSKQMAMRNIETDVMIENSEKKAINENNETDDDHRNNIEIDDHER